MITSLEKQTVPAFRYLLMPMYYDIKELYLFGSRKSAKTKHVSLRMVLRAMSDKDYNGLALRKIAATIKESIKEELQWAINVLGVSHLWHFHGTNNEYTYLPYKTRIKLRGISINPVSGKPSLSGLIVSQGWIKDCWMEEAWEFTKQDYSMVRQTMRGGVSSILIVGNPYFMSMWCVKKAVELFHPVLDTLKQEGEMWKYLPEIRQGKKVKRFESVIHWSNFQINDKLSQSDIDERWEEEETNPKDFQVSGYGYPGSPSGTILGDLTHMINDRDLDYFVSRGSECLAGVDVGLEHDATVGIFCVYCPWGEIIAAESYYHSNGEQEANRNSNYGVWKRNNPHEFAAGVIDYFMVYESVWRRLHPELFRVSVDNADSAFIAILNTDVRNRGIKGIKFIPTKGTREDKKRIELRIIFERQMMSRGLISFLVMKDSEGKVISYPSRLRYEMDNIPYKQVQSTGEVRIERDGSKVHPDTTNAWEYAFRKVMQKAMKAIEKKV